jgi:aspartate/methionine/tyrosine aminotransferase
MAGNNGGKGNPASHRMSNPKRKARREASWNRAQVKKRHNRELNEAQHKINLELKSLGLPTPHELKKEIRRAMRDELREQGLLPPLGTTRAQWLIEKKRKAA